MTSWSDLLDLSPEEDEYFRAWVEERKQFKECLKIILACQLDAGYEVNTATVLTLVDN